MAHLTLTVLLSFLACFYHIGGQGLQCLYYYIQQPPQDIVCDPYGPASTGVSLRCQVIADLPSSSYTVGWFHVPLNATTATQIFATSTIRDKINSRSSAITVTLTLQPRTDSNAPGHYFCMVLPDVDTEIVIVPSDTFKLLPPGVGQYLPEIQCNSVVPRFKTEVKCADVTYSAAAPQTGEITTVTVSENTTPWSKDARTSGEDLSVNASATTHDEGEDNTSLGEDLLHFMAIAYVLSPMALIILILLLIICLVYAIRKCTRPAPCNKMHTDVETRRRPMRYTQTEIRSHTKQAEEALVRPPPVREQNSVTSMDLQSNPSYQLNSRGRSKTHPWTPTEHQRAIHQPQPCRQDITEQEERYSARSSLGSYEDNSYVIMRSSGTNSTLQSSGAYESML